MIIAGQQASTLSWFVRTVRKVLRTSSDLEIIAAERPDKGLVLVVLNRADVEVNFKVVDERLGRGSFVVSITARSIQTFIWW